MSIISNNDGRTAANILLKYLILYLLLIMKTINHTKARTVDTKMDCGWHNAPIMTGVPWVSKCLANSRALVAISSPDDTWTILQVT